MTMRVHASARMSAHVHACFLAVWQFICDRVQFIYVFEACAGSALWYRSPIIVVIIIEVVVLVVIIVLVITVIILVVVGLLIIVVLIIVVTVVIVIIL